MSFYWLFLLCPFCYLIGSVSFSIIISKFGLKTDVRKSGSGNAGATNMLRKFGFKVALATMVLDMLKGLLPALAGRLLYGFNSELGLVGALAMGIAAVLGHCFPIYYKFRGGKGVATTLGVLVVFNPVLGISVTLIGLAFGELVNYASIASFLMMTILIVWEVLTQSHCAAVNALLLGFYLFVVFTHRSNILRLVKGEEKRASMFAKRKEKKQKEKQKQWLKEL